MANEPFFTATGNYQAPEFRRFLATFYNVAAPGGVIFGMGVTQSGASVIVAVGACVITDSTNGVYVADGTSASTISIPSYAAGGSIVRDDTVYAFVSETTGTELSIGVAANTTSIPALAIPLARVHVASTGITAVTMVNAQAELVLVKNRYQPVVEVPFTSPTLSAGWGNNDWNVNAASAGQFVNRGVVPYYGTQFKRTGNVMHLRGSITNLGADTGQPIITVPSAYTPRDTQQFVVTTDDATVGYDTWEIVGTQPDFGEGRTIGGIYGKFRGRWSNAWFNMLWTVNP